MNWQSAVGNVDDDQDNEMLHQREHPAGGSQSISTYMRKQGDSTTYGVSNSGSLGDNTHYYISADRDQDPKTTASTATSTPTSTIRS
jgi:outer membrane usher protein FimD/PapC